MISRLRLEMGTEAYTKFLEPGGWANTIVRFVSELLLTSLTKLGKRQIYSLKYGECYRCRW
jgi:hypothetical protein